MTTTIRKITLKINRQGWDGSLGNVGGSVAGQISPGLYMDHKSDEISKGTTISNRY
jgi:hypothetical protein